MKNFSRRQFIRNTSLFGGGLLLNGMIPSLSSAAGVNTRRLIIVSLGHSFDPISNKNSRQWLPTVKSDGTIDQLAPIWAPIEPFKDRLVAVAGCNNLVARMVRSNGHNASSRTLLNCLPHREYKNPGDGLGFEHHGGGPSIEYILSERFGGVPPLILRCGEGNIEHRRTFLKDGSDDEGNRDPVGAFENLFASMETSGELTSAQKLKAKRGEILDAVRSSYERLALSAGSDDKARLQSHASLIDNFIKGAAYEPTLSCSSHPVQNILPEYKTNFDKSWTGRDDDVIARMHNSLMATAMSCQATRVASLHYTNMGAPEFPFLNNGVDLIAPTGQDWHGISHHDGAAPDSLRLKVHDWYSRMVADLLHKLDATPDGDGNLLDNSIVVLTSNLGNRGHSLANIPFLVFGGKDSGLKTNQVLDYQDTRSLADMWTTIMQLMGQSDESFGMKGVLSLGSFQGANFNNGPLTEMMV